MAIEPLLNLPDAAELLFGDRTKVRALRTEISKGRLEPIRISGTLYVTESELERMVSRCQENHSVPGSTSTRQSKPGSSGTEHGISARDAALAKLREQNKSLPTTLDKL